MSITNTSSPASSAASYFSKNAAGDGWLDTPIYDRSKLGFGAKAQGPLVVEEPTTATVVCPGQSLSVDEYGNLIVEMEVE